MNKLALLCSLLVALIPPSFGAVTTSGIAPVADILASNPTGGTNTRLIDEDANANHARGQGFSLGDGSGSAFEITAVTVRKDVNQTYNNSTLTLRIFEGTNAQWETGSGHSTATDGSDYLVDTTVTLLYTEAFALNGAFNDNDYVTFTLATPLVVSESTDLGFFMVYDQAVGDDDDFEHLEGAAGGRLSITTTGHGVSGSRNMVYFVHGVPINASSVTTSPDAPTVDVISSSAVGSLDTALFAEGALVPPDNHARGQLFSLPDGAGAEYEVTAVTIKKSTSQTFANDTITVRMFEGTQAQWDSGSGHSTVTDGSDYYVGTTVTPLHTQDFALDGTIDDNHYVTFQFGSPITLNEESDFGFFMTYDQVNGANPDSFRHREDNAGAGRISIVPTEHSTSASRGLVYYIHGTATGTEPSSIALGVPFQDGMVLQRNKPVKVWGTSPPDAAIMVSVNGFSGSGTADSAGDWQVELPSLTAGGPYTLDVTSGSETVTLSDVLVGDVWLAFGQSNMVRALSEMQNNSTYINDIAVNNLPIRCLKVTQFGNLTPQENPTIPAGHTASGSNVGPMNWLDKSTVSSWTSVGTVFAHKMYQATGVPTAIIWAAWGSSSIEGWMPAEMAGQLPHFAKHMTYHSEVGNYLNDADYDNVTRANNLGFSTNVEAITSLQASGWSGATSASDIFIRTRPNILYNQMIHPLLNFGISGFVWYQGEANAAAIQNVAQYGFSLPRFVKEYRKRFDQGDLPFLAVQLPSYNQATWPWFRESQNLAASEPATYVAVTIDTGLSGNIHPTDKEPVGTRLSLLARKYVYAESIEAEGPTFTSMNISGNQATISFTHAAGLTTDNAAAPLSFQLAGSDQIFYSATSSSISGSTVTVSSTSVPTPVAVRYAWSPSPFHPTDQLNLINGAGLPAAPFRTDLWPLPGLGAWAPQAVNDSYEVGRDQVLDVPAVGILGNDIDLNFDALTATFVTDVSFGTLSLSADGSFTYTPDVGYAGPDNFTYRSSDGGLDSEVATVNITVLGQPSAYYTWKSGIAWNPGDDESASGDPDLDGITNFLEFALGLNPLQAGTAGLPTLTPSGGDYAYDFNNAQPGVAYEVLLSTDMVTWSDPPFTTLTSASTTPVVIPSAEATNGRLFVRLRVSE